MHFSILCLSALAGSALAVQGDFRRVPRWGTGIYSTPTSISTIATPTTPTSSSSISTTCTTSSGSPIQSGTPSGTPILSPTSSVTVSPYFPTGSPSSLSFSTGTGGGSPPLSSPPPTGPGSPGSGSSGSGNGQTTTITETITVTTFVPCSTAVLTQGGSTFYSTWLTTSTYTTTTCITTTIPQITQPPAVTSASPNGYPNGYNSYPNGYNSYPNGSPNGGSPNGPAAPGGSCPPASTVTVTVYGAPGAGPGGYSGPCTLCQTVTFVNVIGQTTSIVVPPPSQVTSQPGQNPSSAGPGLPGTGVSTPVITTPGPSSVPTTSPIVTLKRRGRKIPQGRKN